MDQFMPVALEMQQSADGCRVQVGLSHGRNGHASGFLPSAIRRALPDSRRAPPGGRAGQLVQPCRQRRPNLHPAVCNRSLDPLRHHGSSEPVDGLRQLPVASPVDSPGPRPSWLAAHLPATAPTGAPPRSAGHRTQPCFGLLWRPPASLGRRLEETQRQRGYFGWRASPASTPAVCRHPSGQTSLSPLVDSLRERCLDSPTTPAVPCLRPSRQLEGSSSPMLHSAVPWVA